MAGALHDGPVQSLANVMVQLEISERLHVAGHHGEALESFAEAKGATQASIAQLRNLIYDLNPMILDDLGLVLTTRNGLNNFTKQTGIQTDFVLLGSEVRLDNQVEMAVFRIIQESLNNCRKHANPSFVKVTLEFSNGHISAEVRDDGIGFAMSDVQAKLRTGKHYGLLSMQNRATVLGGLVQMHSAPGKGTRMLVRIPLSKGEGVTKD
jgi:two-component system sensor histidine kinase DegS